MTPSRAQGLVARVATSTERAVEAGMLSHLGLDLSLANTGMACAMLNGADKRGFSIHTKVVQTPPMEDADERLKLLLELIRSATPLRPPALTVIEGLALSRNDPSTQVRSALHYMVRAKLIADQQRFIVVGPTTLKKFICGTGAAKKELMLKEMFRRYGVDTDDNNQADAAALAIFGLAHDGHIPMTQVQTDQMRSFKLPKVKKAKKGRAA